MLYLVRMITSSCILTNFLCLKMYRPWGKNSDWGPSNSFLCSSPYTFASSNHLACLEFHLSWAIVRLECLILQQGVNSEATSENSWPLLHPDGTSPTLSFLGIGCVGSMSKPHQVEPGSWKGYMERKLMPGCQFSWHFQPEGDHLFKFSSCVKPQGKMSARHFYRYIKLRNMVRLHFTVDI